ncbi:MAG: hypothetical protein HOJ25_03045 [Candidatus Magasanikbacteria bacterium]|jgi:hypothetical protein|nr:hypothetical protein [Candidatus Magasanikbacteria bacterium]
MYCGKAVTCITRQICSFGTKISHINYYYFMLMEHIFPSSEVTYKNAIIVFFMLSLCFFGVSFVHAQEDVDSEDTTQNQVVDTASDVALEDALIDQEGGLVEVDTEIEGDLVLEEVEVTEIDTAPSRFGMFWRGVRERLSLVTTFDPVKKAEKRLRFAEERMEIAEKIAEDSGNENVDERMQKIIDRAQNMIEKVEQKKDDWLSEPDERKKRLMRNIATHHTRRNQVLERIEERLPEDRREKFQQHVERLSNAGKRFFDNVNDEELPEGVRDHIKKHRVRVQAHVEKVKEFNTRRKDLRVRIADGDESAKEDLQQLKERRHEYVKEKKEGFAEKRKETLDHIQQKRSEAREKISNLKDLAKEGDEEAKKALDKLRKRHNEITKTKPEVLKRLKEQRDFVKKFKHADKEERKDLREDRRERIEDRREDHKEKIEDRREDRKEKLEDRRERVENAREGRQEKHADVRGQVRDRTQDIREDRKERVENAREDRQEKRADVRDQVRDRVQNVRENRRERVENRASVENAN